MSTLSIPLSQLYTAVGQFIQTVVGVDPATSATVAVTRGQINRVAMPVSAFINMLVMVSSRISTNEDSYTNDTQVTQMSTKVKMRLDFYGPLAHDWAVEVKALWRDLFGCNQLAPLFAPLYDNDAIQGALVNGEEEYEDRWILELFLQYNPTVTTPQQSANALALKVVNVAERYPPG